MEQITYWLQWVVLLVQYNITGYKAENNNKQLNV
jgi:hypothetical protein